MPPLILTIRSSGLFQLGNSSNPPLLTATSPKTAAMMGKPARARGKAWNRPGGFTCSCGKTYSHQPSLWKHRKFECGKEPQFECPHCPHKTKHKADLAKHVNTRHADCEQVWGYGRPSDCRFSFHRSFLASGDSSTSRKQEETAACNSVNSYRFSSESFLEYFVTMPRLFAEKNCERVSGNTVLSISIDWKLFFLITIL